MEILLNDKKMEVPQHATLAELITLLGISEKGLAIAVNDKIAKKDTWADRQLQADDKVLIISAAYGG